jgi:hypothetical protein
MKYYINFYKILDKKLNCGLTLLLSVTGLLAATTFVYHYFNWKATMPGFEQFLLSLLISMLFIGVIVGTVAITRAIFGWVKNDLIPKFKETQKDLGYNPPSKGTVSFK